MMEKLGQAKTHLELKKMISEVDRENRGNALFLLLWLLDYYRQQIFSPGYLQTMKVRRYGY